MVDFCRNHWVLAVLDVVSDTCYYLDSARPENIAHLTINPQLKRMVET